MWEIPLYRQPHPSSNNPAKKVILERPNLLASLAMDHQWHHHCQNCVFANCTTLKNDCPVQQCPNDCGAALHRCKIEEHTANTCLEVRTPCINAVYGCEETPKRWARRNHLEHCPASTLMCRFSHDREAEGFLGPPTASLEDPRTASPEDPGSDVLLDTKFLMGDLKILRDDDRVIRNHGSFRYGQVSYGDPDLIAASGFSSPAGTRLSTECSVGILTNATGTSEYHRRSQRMRQRMCVEVPTTYQHYYSKKPLSTRLCYLYPCNEIVRRDEFYAHWQSFHLDIQVNMSMIVERCPMYIYGCNYGRQRLVPNPQGTAVDYDKDYDTFLIKAPQVVAESAKESESAGDYAAKLQKQRELALYGYGGELEESFDVLSQLPAEVLTAICHYLDSMSLWQLSQVNHYIRKVCLNTVKKKGIVYHRWVKDEVTKRWLRGPKVK